MVDNCYCTYLKHTRHLWPCTILSLAKKQNSEKLRQFRIALKIQCRIINVFYWRSGWIRIKRGKYWQLKWFYIPYLNIGNICIIKVALYSSVKVMYTYRLRHFMVQRMTRPTVDIKKKKSRNALIRPLR